MPISSCEIFASMPVESRSSRSTRFLAIVSLSKTATTSSTIARMKTVTAMRTSHRKKVLMLARSVRESARE
jgi:hypothetical protein